MRERGSSHRGTASSWPSSSHNSAAILVLCCHCGCEDEIEAECRAPSSPFTHPDGLQITGAALFNTRSPFRGTKMWVRGQRHRQHCALSWSCPVERVVFEDILRMEICVKKASHRAFWKSPPVTHPPKLGPKRMLSYISITFFFETRSHHIPSASHGSPREDEACPREKEN